MGDAENGADGEARKVILVTGGAGYIGSHTCLVLLEAGFSVVVIDNLDNSIEEALNRVRTLAGANGGRLVFVKGDLCDRLVLERVFEKWTFDAVIHFAGLKAVGESVAEPLKYYHNNMWGTVNLLEHMAKNSCKQLVFSSSATVYGQPEKVPCTEESPLKATNPYGRTKLFIEEMMRDVYASDKSWRVVLLRYFNPVGAHPSGRIGEDPKGIPNNLMPYVQQVAVGRRKEITVFGHDYPTKDGTGVRDYIHVMDLAEGHLAALQYMLGHPRMGCQPFNLGTGTGTSVLEMIAAFQKACGKKLSYRLADRRPGDSAEVYASTKKAEEAFGWKARFGIKEMCADQWNWARQNPNGYGQPIHDAHEAGEDS